MNSGSRLEIHRRGALRGLLAVTGGLVTGLGFGRLRPAWAQGGPLTASGSGVNVKQMPSPDGTEMVPLRESFAFDAHYAQCVIEDNAAAFAMDTHTMGRVLIDAHTFFMAMYATHVRLANIEQGVGERLIARLEGELNCFTAAASASTTVGSRTVAEPAGFRIEAVDGGPRGGSSGDSFAFTVFFNPELAPVNYAIFGPEPTFTGDMVAGEITIGPPELLPLT